ncbi:hypothetical protein [Pontixanthobacter sp. CEM42]|uniref:hypothetical protein n=1 Tax=Pontixanthobacter sp. CEM42 TaxID=2792077 RepID=UPI001ADFF025|nr:hypothetical protein [Pontixanthobacter sp. CEM42]
MFLRKCGVMLASLVAAGFMISANIALSQDLDEGEVEGATLGSGAYSFAELEPGSAAGAEFPIDIPDGAALTVTVFDESNQPDRKLAVFVRDVEGMVTELNPIRSQHGTIEVNLPAAVREQATLEVLDRSGLGGRIGILLRDRATQSRPRPEPAKIEFSKGYKEAKGTLQTNGEVLFEFDAEKGQTLLIWMDSAELAAFDSILRLYFGDETTGEIVATNDDMWGSLGSLIVYRVAKSGKYTVRGAEVDGLAGNFTAAFQLFDKTAATPTRLQINGAAHAGALTSTSPLEIDSEAPRAMRFELFHMPSHLSAEELVEADEQVRIVLSSSDFDAFLEVGYYTPFGFSVVESNDDTVGDNSQIDLNPAVFLTKFGRDETEEWWQKLRIRARSSLGGSGDFQIAITKASVGPKPSR